MERCPSNYGTLSFLATMEGAISAHQGGVISPHHTVPKRSTTCHILASLTQVTCHLHRAQTYTLRTNHTAINVDPIYQS